MISPGDIYLVKNARLGSCQDARPCVVLSVFGSKAWVCYLSAQFGCAKGGEVELLKTDPDFPASGLKKASYIPDYREIQISIDSLKSGVRLGCATGEFKKKIEALYGAPLI